jgi:hypothetical protein
MDVKIVANPGTSPPGRFRLLDLPRELRDRVYLYALVRDKITIEPVELRQPTHSQEPLRTLLGKKRSTKMWKEGGRDSHCNC